MELIVCAGRDRTLSKSIFAQSVASGASDSTPGAHCPSCLWANHSCCTCLARWRWHEGKQHGFEWRGVSKLTTLLTGGQEKWGDEPA